MDLRRTRDGDESKEGRRGKGSETEEWTAESAGRLI